MILPQSIERFIFSKKKDASILLFYTAMRMEQSAIMCFTGANIDIGFTVSAVIALPTLASVNSMKLSHR
jgi:hypothetical protein